MRTNSPRWAGPVTPGFALLRRRYGVPLWSTAVLAALTPPVHAVEAASVPVTGRFDLGAAPRPLLAGKWLHDRRHIPQSFAFDDAAGFVYVLQVEGTNAAGTFREHAATDSRRQFNVAVLSRFLPVPGETQPRTVGSGPHLFSSLLAE